MTCLKKFTMPAMVHVGIGSVCAAPNFAANGIARRAMNDSSSRHAQYRGQRLVEALVEEAVKPHRVGHLMRGRSQT
jgi:hypothetical protein